MQINVESIPHKADAKLANRSWQICYWKIHMHLCSEIFMWGQTPIVNTAKILDQWLSHMSVQFCLGTMFSARKASGRKLNKFFFSCGNWINHHICKIQTCVVCVYVQALFPWQQVCSRSIMSGVTILWWFFRIRTFYRSMLGLLLCMVLLDHLC